MINKSSKIVEKNMYVYHIIAFIPTHYTANAKYIPNNNLNLYVDENNVFKLTFYKLCNY